MPWREIDDPYRIYISEIMLQQTQVARVLPHYLQFTTRYPTLARLAAASQLEVLTVWQGLGYNRRAHNLGRACRIMMDSHRGEVPATREHLVALPGIGEATAGAILTYAFGQRVVFIETNIRRVFIHFFFSETVTEGTEISDREIAPLVEATLPTRNLRHWYYALTDYGAALPRRTPNPNLRAAAYRRQPPFVGSHRALRGAIIRYVVNGAVTEDYLRERLPSYGRAQVERALAELTAEGMLERHAQHVRAAEWKERRDK